MWMLSQYGRREFLAGGWEKFVLNEWVVKIVLLASELIYSPSPTHWPTAIGQEPRSVGQRVGPLGGEL